MVDRESGVVRRLLLGRGGRGAGEDLRGPGVLVETHPDTGARLVGLRIPCWDEALALACSAATAFPRSRYQSWDIALADGGPVAVELNFNGDIVQPGQDRGFHDSELQAFLAQYGR